MEKSTEQKGKLIQGFSRYEMLPNGVVRNASTLSVLKVEQKNDAPYVRLTGDKGKRVWLSTEELHKQLFQIDIENKTKPSAKPKKLAKLSKSQQIWIALQSGKTITEVVTENPQFDLGHVRNVAKNYKQNPQKQKQADHIKSLIQSQSKIK